MSVFSYSFNLAWRLSPVDLVWLEDVLRHLFGDGERESVKAKNSTELI